MSEIVYMSMNIWCMQTMYQGTCEHVLRHSGSACVTLHVLSLVCAWCVLLFVMLM